MLLVIGAVTAAAWFSPLSYLAVGCAYLLAITMLCFRLGPWSALFAALASALAWNFFFVPPRLSFSVVHLDDGIILGAYFIAALAAGQLAARIRAERLIQTWREQRASELFHLARALAGSPTLEDAVPAILRRTDQLLNARTALLLQDASGALVPYAGGTLKLGEGERFLAQQTLDQAGKLGSGKTEFRHAAALYVPVVRAGMVLGVMVTLPDARGKLAPANRQEFVETVASLVALVIELERLRDASVREKLATESDRLHRTLLDSVSHELKTPLAILRSAAENLAASPPARAGELVAEIRTATRRLDLLVANLLDQTRIESGVIRPKRDACSIRDIVNAAVQDIGEELAERRVAIDISRELPLVYVDPGMIRQALVNLLLNAVRHTPGGTEISIQAGIRNQGDRMQLSVADRGRGIPAELRPHLFEKFRRGREAGAGGIGLGLSIVRGFVLANDGDVLVDDRPGGGARFMLVLPCLSMEPIFEE